MTYHAIFIKCLRLKLFKINNFNVLKLIHKYTIFNVAFNSNPRSKIFELIHIYRRKINNAPIEP